METEELGEDREEYVLPYVKDSDTSRLAAESMYEEAATLRGKVYAIVFGRKDEGLTCDEAEVLMGGRHQTISARFYELHTSGRIKDSGRRRRTRSGRLAVVYVAQGNEEEMSDGEQTMGTYTIMPATKQEITASLVEAEALLEVLDTWTIESSEDEEQAGQMMKFAHERVKDLDARRKKVVTPAVQAQKDINGYFKPALDAWGRVKSKVNGLLAAVVRSREAANRQALEQVASGDVAALANVQNVEPPSGTAFRDEVQIKIIDEALIPREYLCIDWSALKIAAKEGRQVPGVEFLRQTKVQVG